MISLKSFNEAKDGGIMVKKLMIVYLLLGIYMSSIASAAGAASFNYLNDVDEVTREDAIVYTLYPGMPVKDYEANFKDLPGWSREYRKEYMADYLLKNESKASVVNEYICVYAKSDSTHLLPDANIYAVGVQFVTRSKGVADQIYIRLCNNLNKRWQGKQGPGWHSLGNGNNIGWQYRKTMGWKTSSVGVGVEYVAIGTETGRIYRVSVNRK